MLKTILSITGKPGLFKLISNGKNIVIVESLIDNKKLPISSRDKVVSLGDIAMYSADGEIPLQEVLMLVKQKENGKQASVLPSAQPDELKAYLGEVLPSYDRERIHASDIKKLISWYNILVSKDIDFEPKQEPDNTNGEPSPETKGESAVEKPKKSKPAKTTLPKTQVAHPKVKTEPAAKSEKRVRSKKG
ncbi:MAG: DUF5606 domain-containing protein [Prevotella sp.]|jgi:hypothetical protein|nr:DUF5606 domain-containing protein [Prevotella sp.]